MDRRTLLRAAGLAGLFGGAAATLSSCASPVVPGEIRSDVTRTPPRTTSYASALPPFSVRLFDEVAPAGNGVLSPFSVAVVLAMIRNGAVGQTASELDGVLGASVADLNAELNSTLQALAAINAGSSGVKVNVADSLWGQQDLTWQRPFLDALAANYGAGMRTADFRTRSAQVVDAVNDWVKAETSGLIPKIVTTDMITSMTRLVLANAIHVKGRWLSPFDERSTSKQPFTTASGARVEVDLMAQSLMTDWYETDGWRAAALRLKEPDLALALILPTYPTAPLGTVLGGDGLTRLFGGGRATVQLSMPRWTMRFNRQLKPALTALGMPTAFDPERADFSNMTTQEKLFVSFIVHEAVMTVDEAGVEAAAATVGGMAGTSAPSEIQVLRLDRPFLHALVHVPTRTPLFVGRVDDPTQG